VNTLLKPNVDHAQSVCLIGVIVRRFELEEFGLSFCWFLKAAKLGNVDAFGYLGSILTDLGDSVFCNEKTHSELMEVLVVGADLGSEFCRTKLREGYPGSSVLGMVFKLMYPTDGSVARCKDALQIFCAQLDSWRLFSEKQSFPMFSSVPNPVNRLPMVTGQLRDALRDRCNAAANMQLLQQIFEIEHGPTIIPSVLRAIIFQYCEPCEVYRGEFGTYARAVWDDSFC
jgi:hypothetical protein